MSTIDSARGANLSIQYWAFRWIGSSAISLRMGVEDGVAHFRIVEKDEGFPVRVNTGYKGQLREDSSGDGAVKVPAGH